MEVRGMDSTRTQKRSGTGSGRTFFRTFPVRPSLPIVTSQPNG